MIFILFCQKGKYREWNGGKVGQWEEDHEELGFELMSSKEQQETISFDYAFFK